MIGRMGIDDISSIVSAGLYPAKAAVGELIPVSTAAWREGHDAIGVTLAHRRPRPQQAPRHRDAPVDRT